MVGSPFIHAGEGQEFDVEYSSWGQQQQQQGQEFDVEYSSWGQQQQQQQQEDSEQLILHQQQPAKGSAETSSDAGESQQQQKHYCDKTAAAAAGAVHNCQYVVQPYTQPGALHSFALSGALQKNRLLGFM
jgi:hypothetical protein